MPPPKIRQILRGTKCSTRGLVSRIGRKYDTFIQSNPPLPFTLLIHDLTLGMLIGLGINKRPNYQERRETRRS